MKTGVNAASDTYKLIATDDFISLITGGVYLNKRPQNSKLEDVVIGTLALTNSQLQQGTIMVNIHAPNLSLQIKGKTDTTQPDIATLSKIEAIINSRIGDVYGGEYRMWITQPGILFEDTDGTFYINIRVNYLYFQQNYTNI